MIALLGLEITTNNLALTVSQLCNLHPTMSCKNNNSNNEKNIYNNIDLSTSFKLRLSSGDYLPFLEHDVLYEIKLT